MWKFIKKYAPALLAALAIVLTSCGSDDNSTSSKEFAENEWESYSQAERDELCMGYTILGPDVVEAMKDESDLSSEDYDALMDVFDRECE